MEKQKWVRVQKESISGGKIEVHMKCLICIIMEKQIKRYQILAHRKCAREATTQQLREWLSLQPENHWYTEILNEELQKREVHEKEEEEIKELQPIMDEYNRKQMLKAMGVWVEEKVVPKQVKKPSIVLQTEPASSIPTKPVENLLPPPPNKQMKTYYEEIQEGIRHGCGCLVRSEGEWKERVKQECDECYYTYGDGAD